MQADFEMSMLGELHFFLGLHISQVEGGMFISKRKYLKEMLKNFGMELECSPISTPMVTRHKTKAKMMNHIRYTERCSNQ